MAADRAPWPNTWRRLRKPACSLLPLPRILPCLNAEKWEVFKNTCREASTKRVVAIPGFLYRDKTDVRWVAVGDFAFPLKHRLSADGKRIIVPVVVV